jgi:hypothetical protein
VLSNLATLSSIRELALRHWLKDKTFCEDLINIQNALSAKIPK